MKHGSTLFLKLVICMIGALMLSWLIIFPQFEGRNVHANQFQIYFQDPFLAYVYLTFIPFFIALYQTIRLLGHIENNKVFSPIAVKSLKNIKYCTLAFAGFVTLAMPQIIIFAQDDDAPGVVLIGLVIIFASGVVATGVAVAERLLQKAVDMKSENDLTV